MNHVGHTDPSSPGDPLRLGFADLTPSPLVLRDVEAFLLGLLPDEHVLGGPVRSGPAGSFAVLDGADPQASGVLIRDEEHTPIAALTDLQHLRDSVVRGRLVPVRRRESGSRAELALSRTELSVGSPARRRPCWCSTGLPPPRTGRRWRGCCPPAGTRSGSWSRTRPGNPLPLRTLVATVEAWLVGIGASPAPSGRGSTLSPAEARSGCGRHPSGGVTPPATGCSSTGSGQCWEPTPPAG